MKTMTMIGCAAIALLLVSLTGCRKELCYRHDEHSWGVRVNVVPSWEQVWERPYGQNWKEHWLPGFGIPYDQLRPGIPSGICVRMYGDDMRDERHIPSGGGVVELTEGSHSLLFYNDDTEYIIFNNIASVSAASATTRTRTRASYAETHAGEAMVSAPDMLYGHFIEHYEGERVFGWKDLPVTLRPLVYTYLIRYEFQSGFEYVSLARGALAGMAGSVYLKDGRTGDDAVTVLYDCELHDGYIQAVVKTFGVPDFWDKYYSSSRGMRTYGLNLEVRMKNGKLKDFDFDISSQLRNQPRGGVIKVNGIQISNEEGTEGSSGFNPDVEGWGESEDIFLN